MVPRFLGVPDMGKGEEKMIIFELDTDDGDTRVIYWLGCTSITGADKKEADSICEQLMAQEVFFDA
jgi:hypothetical protein